jgi:LCP family protein required for cell wall assembly
MKHDKKPEGKKQPRKHKKQQQLTEKAQPEAKEAEVAAEAKEVEAAMEEAAAAPEEKAEAAAEVEEAEAAAEEEKTDAAVTEEKAEAATEEQAGAAAEAEEAEAVVEPAKAEAAAEEEKTEALPEGKASGGPAHAKKRMSTPKKVLIAVLATLALLAIVAVVVADQFLQQIDTKISLSNIEVRQLEMTLVVPETPEEAYYVLIMGSDHRSSDMDDGRSDTIMLGRVDPETPALTLLSIPRDTEIELEGYGTEKINAAFTYYGPAGAVNAVSELCGVGISHYVEIDFQGVIDLVDVLGGVDVNVPVDIDLDGVFIPAGEQHLNGAQALIMSRCRSFPDGDFQRVKNQQVLLQAIVRTVLAADKTELPDLITRLADCVKADVTSLEAIDLLLKLQGIDAASNFHTATIPSYPNYHDGVSYVAVEEPAFSEMMQRVKDGLPPNPAG